MNNRHEQMKDTLRWLAAIVQSRFHDGHAVTIEGETRTVAELLDAADAALAPLPAAQETSHDDQ